MKKARIILGILCALCIAGGAYYVQKSRENVDLEGPKLEVSTEKLEVGIETGEEELLKDVVAKDDRDGDVSDSVMISKIEKKKDGEENEFVISYVGFDKSSNSGTLTRDLIYTDYRKPPQTGQNEASCNLYKSDLLCGI